MAGGYTHITLAQLGIREAIYGGAGLLYDDARMALAYFKTHCVVGAIAPDYPYMHLNHEDSAAWADAMHKGRAVDLLRAMAARVGALGDDYTRHKCIAWLFGFASHLVVDGVVHPVVNLKVGPYEENKVEHRVCEMNQDVYINGRLGQGSLESNHQISRSVKAVTDTTDDVGLDPDIAALWRAGLQDVYAGLPAPDMDGWHKGMRTVMTAWENGRYLFFARDTAARHGLVYPENADTGYLAALAVPGDRLMDFDAIADKAIAHTLDMWGWLSLSLQSRPSPLDTLPNWSLDTGIDETGKMLYWV